MILRTQYNSKNDKWLLVSSLGKIVATMELEDGAEEVANSICLAMNIDPECVIDDVICSLRDALNFIRDKDEVELTICDSIAALKGLVK